ncbi:UNVERIFIED_CONTAM: hypothetical protein FKN15_059504 [Acipenser sinensis]
MVIGSENKFTNMEVEIWVEAVLVAHEDVLQARNTSPGQKHKIWNVWSSPQGSTKYILTTIEQAQLSGSVSKLNQLCTAAVTVETREVETEYYIVSPEHKGQHKSDLKRGPGSDAKELPHYCQHYSPWTSHAPHN